MGISDFASLEAYFERFLWVSFIFEIQLDK
jgi:hypothetical protein